MTLVDTNVLLDLATDDPKWATWSVSQLDGAVIRGPVLINSVVCAEFSIGYARIEEVDAILADVDIKLVETPRSALSLPGRLINVIAREARRAPACSLTSSSALHAAVARCALLTRDPRRYRDYVSRVNLISPGAGSQADPAAARRAQERAGRAPVRKLAFLSRRER